jgi:hypothetical protein
MKICTIILTYDNDLYNYFDNIKRKYLDHKKEEYYFVYNGTDHSKHALEEKTYNYFSDVSHPSGIPVMFDKFVDVIKSGLLDEYDYVIRVNSSTFINMDIIRNFLEDKPRSNIYAGFFHPNWHFVSGACIIFSRDVLQVLANNANRVNKNQEDDLAIADAMRWCNVPKTYLDRYCFESHIQDTHITVPDDNTIAEALKYPQIRVRNNSNRELIDKGIWNSIAKKLNID